MIIGIEKLNVSCIIGCLEHERQNEQIVLVDVAVKLERKSTDFLNDTLDYRALATCITKVAKEGKYNLLETLAEKAAEALFSAYKQIASVQLSIKKPGSLDNAFCCYVAYEADRE